MYTSVPSSIRVLSALNVAKSLTRNQEFLISIDMVCIEKAV